MVIDPNKREISWLLWLPALLFGLVVRLRVALYRAGILRANRLPARVISVGNLTVGGTGKTPCVAWIAGFLREEGESVAILSRGYRRQSRGRVEVSDGVRVLATAEMAGDEPWILARACPGTRVLVDSERYEAGKWLSTRADVSVFILDDGYQHLRLKRDLNLLLVDAGDPLPLARMAPLGRLREPLVELRRADAVIVTRSDQEYDGVALGAIFDRYLRPGTPVLHATHEMKGIYRLESGESVDPESLETGPVAAIAGIARPERFYHDLRALGLDLCWTRSFPDHHLYRPADRDAIIDGAIAAGAKALLMTEKDAANWPSDSPSEVGTDRLSILVGRIEFRCREEAALKSILRTGSR